MPKIMFHFILLLKANSFINQDVSSHGYGIEAEIYLTRITHVICERGKIWFHAPSFPGYNHRTNTPSLTAVWYSLL